MEINGLGSGSEGGSDDRERLGIRSKRKSLQGNDVEIEQDGEGERESVRCRRFSSEMEESVNSAAFRVESAYSVVVQYICSLKSECSSEEQMQALEKLLQQAHAISNIGIDKVPSDSSEFSMAINTCKLKAEWFSKIISDCKEIMRR